MADAIKAGDTLEYENYSTVITDYDYGEALWNYILDRYGGSFDLDTCRKLFYDGMIDPTHADDWAWFLEADVMARRRDDAREDIDCDPYDHYSLAESESSEKDIEVVRTIDHIILTNDLGAYEERTKKRYRGASK